MPANTTLTNGVGTFSATLQSPGDQTLVATDTVTSSLFGSTLIHARGLVVTNLTPNAAGYTAQFNKPFDPAQLNLYDAANTFGPDDAPLISGNTVDTMLFGGNISGGFFTLGFNGVSSATIAYSTDPATLQNNIQTALNNLSTIGVSAAGNNSLVSVASDLGSATVTFQNALGLSVQPALTSSSNLTGQTTSVTVGVPSFAPLVNGTLLIGASNAADSLTFGGTITGGTFTLAFNGVTSNTITYSAVASTLQGNIQTALNALSSVGVSANGNNSLVSVVGNSATVTFQNSLGLLAQPPLTVASNSLTGSNSPSVTAAIALVGGPNTKVTFVETGIGSTGVLTAGSYALTFRSATNGFRDLSGSTLGLLDGNNDGVAGDNYTTTFTVAGTPTVMLNIPDFSRGPDSSRIVRVPNSAGSAVENLVFTGAPTGGTFTLSFNNTIAPFNSTLNVTTGTISYSTNAATLVSNIQAALNQLATPLPSTANYVGTANNAGNMAVAGTVATSLTVTFQFDLGGAPQPLMALASNSLTGGASPSLTVSTKTAGINSGIPITLNGASNLTDAAFNLSYNPAYLNLGVAATAGTLTAPFTFNTSTSSTFTLVGTPSNGVASFSFHSSVALNGTVTLGQIVAKVLNSTASSYKGKELLDLSSTTLNGVNIGAVDAITLGTGSNKATGGSFQLAFNGATTGQINYSSTASTLAGNIKTALEAAAGDWRPTTRW